MATNEHLRNTHIIGVPIQVFVINKRKLRLREIFNSDNLQAPPGDLRRISAASSALIEIIVEGCSSNLITQLFRHASD